MTQDVMMNGRDIVYDHTSPSFLLATHIEDKNRLIDAIMAMSKNVIKIKETLL